MKECKCTLAQRMVGDGCSVCNPAKALEYADKTIAELEAEITRLRDERDELPWLLRESLRCLEDAKRQWEPNTTNSDADEAIKRDREWLRTWEAER